MREEKKGSGSGLRLRHKVLLALAAALLASSCVSLTIGAVRISLPDLLSILLAEIGFEGSVLLDPIHQVVVTSVRLPRLILGVVVGAALGTAGATMQGLFRNPLADPGLIGVSSGAALAAVAVTVLGGSWLVESPIRGPWLLSVAAFLGGLLTVLAVYRLATLGGSPSVATMLLAGIAVNALAASGTGAFVYASSEQQLRDFTFWTMGSLGGASWSGLAGGAPLVALGVFGAPFLSGPLNALALGSSEARHLGVDVERLKRWVVGLAAVTAGAAVALAGLIGFVGLVTPHLLRLAFGPDHRLIVPGSALLGAILLVWADLVSRTVVAPAELPVGIVTAVVGGPFFLWLLVRDRRRWEGVGA